MFLYSVAMGAGGDSQVLAYLSLEPLSGETNVSGVTATTRKFINNTRPEVVGQGILKPEERTYRERVG